MRVQGGGSEVKLKRVEHGIAMGEIAERMELMENENIIDITNNFKFYDYESRKRNEVCGSGSGSSGGGNGSGICRKPCRS